MQAHVWSGELARSKLLHGISVLLENFDEPAFLFEGMRAAAQCRQQQDMFYTWDGITAIGCSEEHSTKCQRDPPSRYIHSSNIAASARGASVLPTMMLRTNCNIGIDTKARAC